MTAKPKDAAWVLRMGRHGVQVLAVVLVLALVFTMVNVQQFAAQGHLSFGVQWFIAWLLDPMASLTMAAAIVYEGLLADYGKPKVPWLTATKWYAGVATWGMNIWSSAAAGSFAGIWLHSVAPGLVLGLAEAAPRVRRHMADIIDELERELASPPVEPVPIVELPTPTYARVGPSSWTAPVAPVWRSTVPEPVVTQEPVADPTPVPEPIATAVADGVEPQPTPASAPEPAPAPEVTVPLVEQQGTEVEQTPPERTPEPEQAPGARRVSGGELDAVIAQILDKEGDGIGRRRITAMLPQPRPSDHAVKTALARVKAAREPALNGAGRTAAGDGPAGGDPDGR